MVLTIPADLLFLFQCHSARILQVLVWALTWSSIISQLSDALHWVLMNWPCGELTSFIIFNIENEVCSIVCHLGWMVLVVGLLKVTDRRGGCVVVVMLKVIWSPCRSNPRFPRKATTVINLHEKNRWSRFWEKRFINQRLQRFFSWRLITVVVFLGKRGSA